MKGKITNLVSLEYNNAEEKARAEETFEMIRSIIGSKLTPVKFIDKEGKIKSDEG